MNKAVKPRTGGWELIELAHPDGVKWIKAQLIGFFAVHRSLSGLHWSVTHLRTGCRFPARFNCHPTARSFAKRLKKFAHAKNLPLDNPDPWQVAGMLRKYRAELGELVYQAGGEWHAVKRAAVSRDWYGQFEEGGK